MSQGNALHEVLTYGPIVAHDEELDILITANGAYFNIWAGDYVGKYQNTEAYDLASRVNKEGMSVLYVATFVEVMDAAERLLAEVIAEDEEDDDSTSHDWQTARFTGARTCSRCGLLPLDDDDYESECEGRAS